MVFRRRIRHLLQGSTILLASMLANAGDGKLLGTTGLSQLEGSGGGGLVPWATLSGYDSGDEVSGAIFSTNVNVQDYHLQVWGANVGLYDRLELSYARQTFDLSTLGLQIRQSVVGAKVRLYGDVVYSDWPQVSVGWQRKTLVDDTVALAVGAKEANHGDDVYLAATKLHLGLAAGYNVIWNLAVRGTKANQLGLLGFGGEKSTSRNYVLEGSLGVLLNQHWAVGAEYRQKPDNLGLKEDDWKDIFVSYFPNKHLNLTLAYASLGEIANAGKQEGLYLSLTGYLW